MMQSLHHRTLVCSFVFFFFSFLFNPQIALAQPDTIPPTLNCPGNLTINTPFSGCDTILNYTVTAFDNEPGVVFEQVEGIPSGDPYPMGLTKNTFLATDAAGNTSSCQFTIRLTFGGIVCADMSFIYLDAQCQASITSPQILEGLTQYSCPDSFKVDYDPTFAGPPANGPWYPANNLSAIDAGKLYYVRVTDRFTGNSCWGQIRILDTVAPQPICPNISIPLNVPDSLSSPAALVNILGFPAGNITYQDNCTVADTITYFDNLNIINCNAGGNVQRTINRLWSATDLYGNTGTCLQKIQFRRDPEDIIFPPDVSLSCKDAPATTAVTGRPYTMVNGIIFSLPAQMANGFFITHIDSIFTGSCEGTYTIKRKWEVYDLCASGNGSLPAKTHTQLIAVTDHSGPNIEAPEKIIFSATASNDCMVPVQFPEVIISDTCSAIEYMLLQWFTISGGIETRYATLATPASPTAPNQKTASFEPVTGFEIGVTEVTWYAEDKCGNTTIVTSMVEIYDSIPPVPVCDTVLTVQLNTNNSGTLDIREAVLSWTDNCAMGDIAVRGRAAGSTDSLTRLLTFDCADLGPGYPFEVWVYDVFVPDTIAPTFAPSQVATCEILVEIRDDNPLFCVPPAPVSITCSEFTGNANDYGDFKYNCQVDSVNALLNTAQFQQNCNAGTITRQMQVFRGGSMQSCSQNIVIAQEPNDYYIRFPNDLILPAECLPTFNFGNPVFTGADCLIPEITYSDVILTTTPGVCYSIERTWTVLNGCFVNNTISNIPNPNGLAGPTVSHPAASGQWAPTISSIQNGGTPVNFGAYWNPNGNGYTYKQTIRFLGISEPVPDCSSTPEFVCDTTANDPLFWNSNLWLGVPDPDLSEAPAGLSMSFKSDCHNLGIPSSVDYILYLDVDNNGVEDTRVSSLNIYPQFEPDGSVFYGDIDPNIPGIFVPFDNRNVSALEKYVFDVQLVAQDTVVTATLVWHPRGNPGITTPVLLPLGNHRIVWIARSFCNSEGECTASFQVDNCCPNPEIACTAEIPTYYLDNSLTAQVNVEDLVLSFEDFDCQSVLGVSADLQATTPPLNASGGLDPSIVFDCNESGIHSLRLWIINEKNQYASCDVTVDIVDTTGLNCNPSAYLFGNIHTPNSVDGVENVRINFLSLLAPLAFVYTDSTGDYSITQASIYELGYTASPYKNDDPYNGLTAFDLVKISRHILNLEPLEYPYQIIAADANLSNTITTFDIVELRKLLLGTYSELPVAPSWVFIPETYLFTTPGNPFVPQVPFIIPVNSGNNFNFIGVKIGDLDNSVVPNFTDNSLADRNRPETGILTDNKWVNAGETELLLFRTSAALAAFQGTLRLNAFELEQIFPGEGLSLEDFNWRNDKQLSFVSFQHGCQFALQVKALQSGYISDLLHLSGEITPAIGFDPSGTEYALRLGFETVENATDHLLIVRPNPFHEMLHLTHRLNVPGSAAIDISDSRGRVVHSLQKEMGSDWTETTIHTTDWPAGIYTVRLRSAEQQSVLKVIRR